MARTPACAKKPGAATACPAASDQRDIDEVLAGAPLERVWRVHVRLSREERVTAHTLAAELGVTPRTVKRDIDLMRERLGLPIEWDRGEHSYVYTRPCDTLPLLRLDAREALAVALAGRLFDRWHGSPGGRLFSDLMRRIAPIFGGVLSVAVDSMDATLSTPRSVWQDEIGHLLTLVETILGHRVVRLDYAKPTAARPERRIVHPLHLAELDGRWVLVAHDPSRGRRSLRNFLLTRIRAIHITAQRFEPPRDFDPAAYIRGSMGRFVGDRECEVRIALDAHAAAYARENPWHPSQQIVDRPGGGAELTLRLNHLADARATVLRWGEHAEVLAPAELREQVRESLQRAFALYS